MADASVDNALKDSTFQDPSVMRAPAFDLGPIECLLFPGKYNSRIAGSEAQ